MQDAVECWPEGGRVCRNVKCSLSLCVMFFVMLDDLENYKVHLRINKSEHCCGHAESTVYACDVM